eukprot:TRINITY_DN1658_c2_g1_i1.p1 TRINITY_DN1658_c2_g1~~TRINITY_DN1658_c2_g1_i1.p1  ORF type:complete len:210 (+),score=29.13 TRINITY_DN1658_c2_g1_i1:55-684(+)
MMAAAPSRRDGSGSESANESESADVGTRRHPVGKVLALAVGCGVLISLVIMACKTHTQVATNTVDSGNEPVDPSFCKMCKDPHSGLDPNSAVCLKKCAPRTASSGSVVDTSFAAIYVTLAVVVYFIIGVFVAAVKGPDPNIPEGLVSSNEASTLSSQNDACSQACSVLNCFAQCLLCCSTCTTDEIIRARCIFVFTVLLWPIACFVPLE